MIFSFQTFAKVISLLYDTTTMILQVSDQNSKDPSTIRQKLAALAPWPWELIPLLTTFAWLYRRTMPPGISSWIIEGWDSAVLQLTGSTWGIPHSPGYPLYTILSNLFVRLVGFIPGLWQTEPAWRVTLWSTFTSLFTILMMYLLVRRLIRNRTAAITAAALLGLSFIFWRAAIMAEVYSLNALIFALTFWLALVWDTDRRSRWLALLGLVVGAGLAHHRTAAVLLPTVALWIMLRRPAEMLSSAPEPQGQRWRVVLYRWLIFGVMVLPPLLSYLYLPWAAQNQVGQTWLYADTSDWNTFWFVVLTREWWGLVQIPVTPVEWLTAFQTLFRQQADQITIVGVLVGLTGLGVIRRYFWLFAPSIFAFFFFGVSYRVADLDSMLIPLTMLLCIGVGAMIGLSLRRLASWLVRSIRVKDEAFRGRWLSPAVRAVLAVGALTAAYAFVLPLARTNYANVDLSGDWQAVDLVEEVSAIAQAGTPLSIIGQDNSVLPDFIYAQVVLDQPVEPLSTTTLARMPEADSIKLLQDRFEQGNRVFVDIETIDLGFIPWLSQAIESDRIFLAPTGHPYLWELLPRPMGSILPKDETWNYLPPGQFLDGQTSIIAYNNHLLRKRTGCFLRLTLFWRVEGETPLPENYHVSVQPLGGDVALGKNDHLALMRGYLPLSEVQPGEIVRDEVDLLVRQPLALIGVNLVVNLYQVQGDQFPTFGQVTIPITVQPDVCQ